MLSSERQSPAMKYSVVREMPHQSVKTGKGIVSFDSFVGGMLSSNGLLVRFAVGRSNSKS